MKIRKILLPIFLGVTLMMASVVSYVSGVGNVKKDKRVLGDVVSASLDLTPTQEDVVHSKGLSNVFEIVKYDGLEYNGANQTLMTITPVSGKIYYKVVYGAYNSSDAITATTYASCNYGEVGETINISAKEVGTYTIYYYAPAISTYDELSSSATVTIGEPKTNNYFIVTHYDNLRYTGEEQNIIKLSALNGGVYYRLEVGEFDESLVIDKNNYEYTSYSANEVTLTAKIAGTYTVYYYCPETDNTLEIASSSTITIENVEIDVTVDPNGGTWNGSQSSSTFTQLANSSYALADPTPPEGQHFTGWAGGYTVIEPVALKNEIKTFNGNEYIELGEEYNYTDKIFISVEAHMSDWAQMNSQASFLSWNTSSGLNGFLTKGEYISFDVEVSTFDGSPTIHSAISSVKFSDLSSGWHTFVGSFDGNRACLYIDGQLIAFNSRTDGGTGGIPGYTSNIYVGAIPYISDGGENKPEYYFNGILRNVYVANSYVNAESIYSGIVTYSVGYSAIHIASQVQATTLTAQWAANTYTINFNGKDATSGVMNPQEGTYNVQMRLNSNTFEKEGFFFGGWATEDYDIANPPAPTYADLGLIQLTPPHGAEINLYAIWLDASYTANAYIADVAGVYPSNPSRVIKLFKADQNLAVTDEYDKLITALGLDANGYALGYATDVDGVNIETIGVEDLTVNFYITRKSYTLTLDANGGEFGSSATKTITKKYGEAYGSLTTPIRYGYTFVGWRTEATGGTEVTSTTTMGSSDTTIYAHWTVNTYTVTLNAKGGTVSPTSMTVTFDSAYGNLPTPVRPGYRFDGWLIDYAKNVTFLESTETDSSTGGLIENSSNYWTSQDLIPFVNTTGSDIILTSNYRLCGIYVFDINGTLIKRCSDYATSHPIPSGTYAIRIEQSILDLVFADAGLLTLYYESNFISNSTTVNFAKDHTLEAQWTAVAPTIDIESDRTEIAYNEHDITFTANAEHDLDLTYQWYRSTSADFTPDNSTMIGGAINPNYVHLANDLNVGTYYYKCIATAHYPDGTSLSTTSNEIRIIVNKSDNLFSLIINHGLEYTGEEQVLLELIDSDGIDNNIYYSIGKLLTSSNYNTDGSTKLPTGLNAKEYEVYYYVPASINYNEVSGGAIVEISKVENVLMLTSKQNMVYDGTAQTLAIVEHTGDQNVYYNVGTELNKDNYLTATGTTTTPPTRTDAGDYLVYFYVPANDNLYELKGKADVTILRADNILTINPAQDLIYNGTEQELLTIIDNNGVDNDIYYNIGTELNVDNYLSATGTIKTSPKAKNIGIYTIYYYIPQSTNYKALSGAVDVEIKAKLTTLTINPNEGIWGGSSENSIFTQYTGSTMIIDDPLRTGYKFNGWTASDGALFENKLFTFDAVDVTLTANWEKVPPTITITSDKTEIMYGLESAKLTAIASHELEITYQWHRSTTKGFTPSGTTAISNAINTTYTHNRTSTDVGTHYYVCIATANGESATSNEIEIIVRNQSNSIQVALGQDLIYNGTEQILLTATDKNNVEDDIYYSVNKPLTESNYSTDGTKTAPTATNAGNYNVYVYVPASKNFEEAVIKTLVSIEKAKNTFEVNNYLDLVFNGNPQVLAKVVDYNDKNDDVYYNVGNELNANNYDKIGSTNLPTGTEDQDYIVYFYVPATDNYHELSGFVDARILPKLTTLTINPNGGIWDSKTENSTFTEGNGTTKTIEDPTRAGYSFTGWTITEGAKFENGVFTFHTTDITFTANWEKVPPTITISIDVNEIVYAGEIDATLTADAKHDLEITYQWYRSKDQNFTPSEENAIENATNSTYIHTSTETPVGIYYYKAIATANDLSTTSKEVKLEVTKSDNLIMLNPSQGLVYNGLAQVLLTVTDNNGVDNDIYYAIDTPLTSSNYDTAGSTSLPTRTNAGEYNVYVYVPENNNYKAIMSQATVIIDRRDNSFELIRPQKLIYNGEAQVLVQIIDHDETDNNVYYKINTELTASNYNGGSTNLPTATDAGTYNIYFYVPQTTNYKAISGRTTNTISKAENIFTVNAGSDLMYTGEAQVLVEVIPTYGTVYYNIGAELNAENYDKLETITTEAPTATDVGTYEIYFYVPESNNYLSLNGSLDVTINIKYTTLTIDPNGGTWNGTSELSIITEGNGTTKPIADAVRDGYDFTGWTFTGGGTWDAVNKVFTYGASNATLTAVWDGLMYEVSYNGNGATQGEMSNSVHTYDVEQALNQNTYSRTGYTFAGWATTADGIAKYIDQEVVKNLATSGVFELFAVWTANSYEVVYNANGGTGTMDNSTHTYDVESTLTENAYTKTGYNFAGWATSADGEVVYENQATIKNLVTSGTYNLFAIWTAAEYTVSFNSNGGSDEANITVTYDQPYGTLPTPTKDGYTFDNWYLEEGFTTVIVGTTTVTTASNHILYAKWTINPYKMNLDFQGGTEQFLYQNGNAISGTFEDSNKIPTFNGLYSNEWIPSNAEDKLIYEIGENKGKYVVTLYLYSQSKDATAEVYLKDDVKYDILAGEDEVVELQSDVWTYVTREFVISEDHGNVTLILSTTADKLYIDDIKVRRIDGYTPKSSYDYTIESEAITLPYAVKAGYTFIGWNTSADGSGNNVTIHEAGQYGNIIYYAIYALSNPTAVISVDNSTVVYKGTDATLSAIAYTEGVVVDSIAYQWYRDGVAIDGATNATYVHIASELDVNTYTYYCKVSTTKGSETSDLIQSTSLTITVSQARNNLEISMDNYTYNGTVSEPQVITNDSQQTVTFYYNTTGTTDVGELWADITPTTLPAGTYYIYATTPETTNYKAGISNVVEFVVETATIEIRYAADSDAVLGEDTDNNPYTIVYSSKLDANGLTVRLGATNVDVSISYWVGEGEKTTVNSSMGSLVTFPSLTNAGIITYNYSISADNYTTINGTITLSIDVQTTSVKWEVSDSYIYNGTDQSANVVAYIEGVDGNIACDVTFSGQSTEFKDAGTYTATATLDNNNYVLVNNTIELTINKLAVSITANNKNITYKGTSPTYDYVLATDPEGQTIPEDYNVTYKLYKIVDTGTEIITTEVTGTENELDVGTYTITPNSDLSADNYEVTYNNGTLTIVARQLAQPTVTGTYTYNGTEQTVELNGFDESTMEIVSGNTATNAGDYNVVIALKYKANYTWANGSTDDISLSWSIAKFDLANANIADIEDQPLTGSEITPEPQVTTSFATLVKDIDFTYSYSNNIDATTEAVVTITAAANSNYTGTNSKLFTIVGAFIKLPTVTGTYTYNGSQQTVTLNGFDENTMKIISGNIGTNADNYEIEIALVNPINYTWELENGTTTKDNQFLTWSIAKADVTLGIEHDDMIVRMGETATNNATITLDYQGNLEGKSLSVDIDAEDTGSATISASAINSSNVSTITISPTKSGQKTITVSYVGDENHNASNVVMFTINIPTIYVAFNITGEGSATLTGTIAGTTNEVKIGANVTFTAIPGEGYGLAKYMIGGKTTYISSVEEALTETFTLQDAITINEQLIGSADASGNHTITISLVFEKVVTLDVNLDETETGSITHNIISKYDGTNVAYTYTDNKLTVFESSTIELELTPEYDEENNQYYVVHKVVVGETEKTVNNPNKHNITENVDDLIDEEGNTSAITVKAAKVYSADERNINDVAKVTINVDNNFERVTIGESKYVVENSKVDVVITETNSEYDFVGMSIGGKITLRDQLNSSEWTVEENERTWNYQDYTSNLATAEPIMLERWYTVDNDKDRTVEVAVSNRVSARLVHTEIGYSYTLADNIFKTGADPLYAGSWKVVVSSTTADNYKVMITTYSGDTIIDECEHNEQFVVDASVTKVEITIQTLEGSIVSGASAQLTNTDGTSHEINNELFTTNAITLTNGEWQVACDTTAYNVSVLVYSNKNTTPTEYATNKFIVDSTVSRVVINITAKTA